MTKLPTMAQRSTDRGIDAAPDIAHSMRVDLPMSAMDGVPMGIARVDRHGLLTYGNRPLLKIAGLGDWRGHSVRDLFRGEDLAAVLDGLGRRGIREGDEYEVNLTRTDGVCVPISITAFPETRDGEVIGTLALVRDLTMERATETIVKLVENLSETQALLDAVTDVFKPMVPFDLLQVVRLNAGRTHLRTIYPEEAAEEHDYRWWRIPASMRNLLDNRGYLIINDLRGWYEQRRADGLAQDLAIESFMARGYSATLSLPVFHKGEQVASVVLSRKSGRTFSEEEAILADRLPLTEAVSVALRNDTENDLKFLIRLIHDIAAAYDSVRNVSQKVVSRIAEHYGWDHVSIHQVDAARGVVRLIAQEPPEPGMAAARAELAIDGSIVGSVFVKREPVRIDNLAPGAPRVHCATQSVLCVPIGASAHWLLYIEDDKSDAFCPEDEASLSKVATSLDALLRCTLEYNYRAAIVKSANDAILLVDERHRIFEANEAAGQLLNLPREDIKGRAIAEFFQDQGHADILLEGEAFENHGTHMLRHAAGSGAAEPVEVLLSVALLPDETPGRVFVASDLTQYVRSDELDVARDLFREITGQVKTPMSLAISWLRRFSHQYTPDAADLPEKVLQQLRKAELTLDRMLLIERGGEAPPRFPTLLPVSEVVQQSLEDLPARERETVQLVSDAPQAWVRADAYELRYCVQTVLTYLLRLAVKATSIELRTWQSEGRVCLAIGGRADVTMQDAFEAQCRSGQVVAELSLGRHTLTEIAERNGGRYEEHRSGDHALFSFWFPSARSGDGT
jgi:PAS domain S-box-containing protein